MLSLNGECPCQIQRVDITRYDVATKASSTYQFPRKNITEYLNSLIQMNTLDGWEKHSQKKPNQKSQNVTVNGFIP